jgi:dUTP pyrophosphatase
MKFRYIKTDKEVPDLEYSRDGDIAFDLRSNEDDYVLKPMEQKVFNTGIRPEIPTSCVGNIRGRSGFAVKHAIDTLGGIIDPNFRGEMGVILINLGSTDFKVEKHMRIAQMLIQRCEIVEFEKVTELNETNRGESWQGSSGYK